MDTQPAARTDPKLETLSVNTIRTLAMDAVQAANSGHPGTPMALAPVVYCLWQDFLRFDPEDPIWPNRDRFVLSNGHASMARVRMVLMTRRSADCGCGDMGLPPFGIEAHKETSPAVKSPLPEHRTGGRSIRSTTTPSEPTYNLALVQKAAGHKSIRTTVGYVHLWTTTSPSLSLDRRHGRRQ